MKRIMFNDKYGLTQAVLDGRKTQTRRIIKAKNFFETDKIEDYAVFGNEIQIIANHGESLITIKSNYKVGEIVAIAQRYKDVIPCESIPQNKMWNNKMFVSASFMPHQIRITNLRIERLQDISDEDCLSEGIVVNEPKIQGGVKSYYPCEYLKSCADKVGWGRVFDTPRKAYAELIDKVSGKGTWKRNPYVFVYYFELVK